MNLLHRFLLQSPYTKQTQDTYRHLLGRLSEWLQENGLELKKLTVDQYFSYINEHRWSQNTERLHINAARSYVRWRYGDQHPITSFRLPRHDSKPGRSLNERKLQELIASFDTATSKGCRDLAIVSLLVETGIRAQECATLRLDYLKLEDFSMTVLAKGQQWQVKVFSKDTSKVLGVWLGFRPEFALPATDTVFVAIGGNTPGKPLTKYGVQSIFRYKSEALGYKISPHDMRRTFATLFIQHGAPTRVVQKLGGWKSLNEVERYTQNLDVKDVERYSPFVRNIDIDVEYNQK